MGCLPSREGNLAALRRTEAQARKLLEIVEGTFEALETPNSVVELDIRFHELIAQASGNSLYAIIVGSFRIVTRQTWHIGWLSRATFENRAENICRHQRIAEANQGPGHGTRGKPL